MQQGAVQGSIQTAREAVLDVLGIRFERVPRSIVHKVEQLDDPGLLRELHRRAVSIGSPEEFEQALPA